MIRRLLLLLSPGLMCCAHAQQDSTESSACRVAEIRRDTLRIGSDPTYVEPQAVVQGDGGQILIAGRLNYRYRLAGSHYRLVDPPFGVILGSDGSVTPLTQPLSGRIADGIRAARVPGGWGVAFAEMPGSDVDSAVALWYGEVRDGRWETLERITAAPQGYRVRAASALVGTRSGVGWAVPVPHEPYGVWVLRRIGGQWQVERVPSTASRAEPILADGRLESLVVLQADPSLPYDDSSVLLLRREAGWRPTQVLSAGRREPAGNIHFQEVGKGGVLTWRGARGPGGAVMRALIFDEFGIARPVTIDRGAQPTDPLGPAVLGTGELVWGTLRVDSGGSAIQLHITSGDSTRVLHASRSPFIRGYALVAVADSLVLIGAVTEGKRFAAALRLTLRVQCGPAPS